MEEWNKETALDEAEINEHDLQNEWNLQPVIFLENSLRVSELTHRRDTLKSSKVSEVTEKYHNSNMKLTDAALGRELDSDQELINLTFDIANCKASVAALAQKKTSLENLTTLWINGLNAEPKTSEEKKAVRDNIKKGLREQNGENKDSDSTD
ncbi:MAG: hypothetical protein HOG49_19470 [Candidatus Scalindua sp.]|nr:hypothetical protein [Candidatus Scalindua sp.]